MLGACYTDQHWWVVGGPPNSFKYNHTMYNKGIGCFNSLQESFLKNEHMQHNLEYRLVILLVESVATETSVMGHKEDRFF